MLYRSGPDLPATLTGAERNAVEDSLAAGLAALEPGSDLAHHAQESFISAMQVTSLVAAGITAAAAVVAWRVIPSNTDQGH